MLFERMMYQKREKWIKLKQPQNGKNQDNIDSDQAITSSAHSRNNISH
jgi:hypothetical protein